MLRCFISGNPRVWEDLLPHVEFSYNRVVNSTTSHFPFEVVYGFNPLTPLYLLPIPILDDVLCKDGDEKASFMKNLHKDIKLRIEKKVGKYAVFGASFGEFLKHRTLIHFYKSASSFSNSIWFHKMSKNHLYLAIGIISVKKITNCLPEFGLSAQGDGDIS